MVRSLPLHDGLVILLPGIPFLSEKEEVWWEERRAEGKASSDDLDHCIGFSQLIRTITKAVRGMLT